MRRKCFVLFVLQDKIGSFQRTHARAKKGNRSRSLLQKLRSVRTSVMPIMSGINGILDVYTCTGSINTETLLNCVRKSVVGGEWRPVLGA